jgi:hypothetical protein
MLNSPQFYVELGAKAAEARNQRDEARAKFHAEHFRKAKALEQGDDRIFAATLYRDAYEANRIIR